MGLPIRSNSTGKLLVVIQSRIRILDHFFTSLTIAGHFRRFVRVTGQFWRNFTEWLMNPLHFGSNPADIQTWIDPEDRPIDTGEH